MTASVESHASADDLVDCFWRERPSRRLATRMLCLLLAAALGLGGWKLFGPGIKSNESSATTVAGSTGALTHTVSRSRLLITVDEDDGSVESSKNVDVKCHVAGGSSILWIVADGTEVEEGETLVILDQSTIEEQLNAQKITFEKARASKIQAEVDFETAVLSAQEYAEGTSVKEMQIVEANINIAQENLRSAENLLMQTRKMSRKGFATSLQVAAAEFAAERSKLELDSAKTAHHVLQDFTHVKTLKEQEAKREATAAKVRCEQAGFQLEKDRLDRLERQLRNCVIKSPQNGIVIYANERRSSRRSRSSSALKIEEGAHVRESQTILRLPDLASMQVRVTVDESKVERLRIGMPARIIIQDREFSGEIVAIANQPEPTSVYTTNTKEYATIIKIDGDTEGLKLAMTASVELLVADLPDVLTIPVNCVVEKSGKLYVWVVGGKGTYERRTLVVGLTNDKLLEIKDGIKEGDAVLVNPRAIVAAARREDLQE